MNWSRSFISRIWSSEDASSQTTDATKPNDTTTNNNNNMFGKKKSPVVEQAAAVAEDDENVSTNDTTEEPSVASMPRGKGKSAAAVEMGAKMGRRVADAGDDEEGDVSESESGAQDDRASMMDFRTLREEQDLLDDEPVPVPVPSRRAAPAPAARRAPARKTPAVVQPEEAVDEDADGGQGEEEEEAPAPKKKGAPAPRKRAPPRAKKAAPAPAPAPVASKKRKRGADVEEDENQNEADAEDQAPAAKKKAAPRKKAAPKKAAAAAAAPKKKQQNDAEDGLSRKQKQDANKEKMAEFRELLGSDEGKDIECAVTILAYNGKDKPATSRLVTDAMARVYLTKENTYAHPSTIDRRSAVTMEMALAIREKGLDHPEFTKKDRETYQRFVTRHSNGGYDSVSVAGICGQSMLQLSVREDGIAKLAGAGTFYMNFCGSSIPDLIRMLESVRDNGTNCFAPGVQPDEVQREAVEKMQPLLSNNKWYVAGRFFVYAASLIDLGLVPGQFAAPLYPGALHEDPETVEPAPKRVKK